MKDFIAPECRPLLARHGLDRFSALWALELDAVDAPNTGRGGWSSVSRLELRDEHGKMHAFYLKRQIDHLSRSLLHPLGEATFAREFRNIQRYRKLDIPALQAAYFGQRKIAGKVCALLLTHALDDYRPLDTWMQDWHALSRAQRNALIDAAADLVGRLHSAGQLHNCLYPKHIFIRLPNADGTTPAACLIDLEKTRRTLRGRRSGLRDLDTLNRHSGTLSRSDRLRFLLRYCNIGQADALSRRLAHAIEARRSRKARHR